MTIPFAVNNIAKDCLIELRNLYDGRVVARIFHDTCQPGVHSVEFDPQKIEGGLEAGLYVLYVKIGDESESYPLQYMP
jgi:hypothetical protein